MSNLNPEIESCIICVESLDGYPQGTGFILTPTLAVTCAHVVQACGAGPDDEVHLVFRTSGTPMEAEVLADGWHEEADVAFLRLLSPLPSGITPAALSVGPDGVRVRAFGYPNVGEIDGLWGTGELSGRVTQIEQPLLQLRSTQITAGFSGGPVWEEASGRVIGMVTSVAVPDDLARLGDVAFAIPSETLRDLCPVELELRPIGTKSDKGVPTGSIRAGRIQARNVVSGIQLQGSVPPEVAGLAELAQAIQRGGIEAEEVEADSVVDGLQFVTGAPPDAPVDDDKGG